MDLNEGICSHKVQVTCCFFCLFVFCGVAWTLGFFFPIFSDAAVYSLDISCNFFLPVYFQRSQLLLLLLLVQEVHNHAEIAEFCQCPPPHPLHAPAPGIQIFVDQKWQISLKMFG